MNISSEAYLSGELDTRLNEGNFRFDKGKFLGYEVIKALTKNRGDADLYYIEDEETDGYILTLYKTGMHAPRNQLLQVQDLSKSKGNNIAPLIQCGFSEHYERDYAITKVTEFGNIKTRRIRNYKRLIKQIVNSFEVAHDNEVIHFDLRPEDIIIESINPNNYSVFGFGQRMLEEQDQMSKEINTIKGLGKYQAPEVAHSKGRRKSDFWSLGVILYELIVGRYPLEHETNNFGNYNIKFTKVEVPRDVDKRYRELIEGLLTINTRKRWGLAEVKDWLIYDREEHRVRETFQTEKFIYNEVEYESLEDLHERLAYTPKGYGELEKLYFRGHITKWLADTQKFDLLKELEEDLSNKYAFNNYIYKYTSEDRELYFKGYDLSKYETLKMLSDTDINKLAEFIPPINKKTQQIRDEKNANTALKLNNGSRIDKNFFYYGYIDNRDLYYDNQKASTYNELPDFDIASDANIRTYLNLRNQSNFDSVDNYLREILSNRGIGERLKESLLDESFQLTLFNNNIVDHAHSYMEFKEKTPEENLELNLFKKLYKDYKFLSLPFENLLIEKGNLNFYEYYVKETFGEEYYNYYERITKKFEEETLVRYLSFKDKESVFNTYPNLSSLELQEDNYIRFNIELLEKIAENKLYEDQSIECNYLGSGINKLFKKLFGK